MEKKDPRLEKIAKETKFLMEYYYCTRPKSNPNIEVFVCEDTCHLHFINLKTNETVFVINDTNY